MKYLMLIFAFIMSQNSLFAQNFEGMESGDFVKIRLKDGSEIQGEITKVTASNLELKSSSIGTTILQYEQINAIKKMTANRDGSYSLERENPFYSKYFISESAIGLEQGRGYYQNIMIVGNVFSYGVTNNVAVTAGFETVSLFQGDTPGMLFGAKFTTDPIAEDLHIGAGANLVTSFGNGYGGSVYGMATYGDKNNNITLGVGFGYIDDDFADTPVIQLGGVVSVSDSFAIVGDNLIVSSNGDLYGFGTFTIRYMSNSVAIDIGVATAYGEGALPVLSAAIAF